MVETVTIPRDELEHLQGRAKKLADEKSYLQLVIQLMNRISTAPGLDNTIEAMLTCVLDVIGATNIILYYRIDNALFYTDVYGKRAAVDRIADALVQQVFDTRRPLEDEHPFAETQMLTAEFTKAYTWVFPLLVGPELIGVFKMENLIHIGMREWYEQLPVFFHYAALILKNEIMGHTRLKQAYDELSQAHVELTKEVGERRRAEGEILRLNAQLEQRVVQRTAELRAANEQLQVELAERKRAENALRLSEQRYRQIVETAEEGIWLLDRDWKTTFANARMESMLGWQPGGMLGRHLSEFMDRKEWQQAMQLMDRREHGVRETHDFKLSRRDGSEAWTLLCANMVADEAGEFVGFLAMATDITERKRAEENLRESERKLRAIFDHTFQFIGLMTPDGILIEANRGALELVGARRSDVLGKPFWDAPWWAHSREIQAKVRDSVNAASGGQFVRFETTHRAHDGRSVCVDFSLTPVSDDQGHVVLIIPEGRDITERKLAEETDRRLALIVESTDDAVIAKTLDGTILTWNGGAERLYGYCAQEVVGKSISILVPPDFSDELPQILAKLEQGKRIRHYETTRIGKDGRKLEVSLCVSPLTDNQGTIVGASTIARDITERKRAEASLRESQRKQAESERLAAIGRVAARVAHEINNPLAGIRNSFRLVRDAVAADHPDRDMVERMEREIDRISHIVQQMYLLYRQEAARIGDIVVAQVIEDVLAMLEPLRRERDLVLSAGAAPPGLTVRLAEGILQQILYNLVANAVEASPEGGAIAISAALAAKYGQDSLTITVRDGGHGIPPAIQHRIFEPFFTTKSGDRLGKGLGLGLSIVRSIVEAHGGSISLESTPGQGTVFLVSLPCIPTTKEQ